jgi:DUF2950 family protein
MMGIVSGHGAMTTLRAMALSLLLIGSAAAATPQPSFPTAEAAVSALVTALQSDDAKAASTILGPGSERLIASGDQIADRNSRKRFLDAYAAQHALDAHGPDEMVLSIGTNGWPMPFPIVRAAGQWHFDATAGAEEVINRRIGRNELATIRTLLAFVEAERDYFDRAQRGTGTGFYAQRVLSTPGKLDGLFWETDDGDPPSPLDPLVQQARDEGYPGQVTAGAKPAPYHGYLFRVLRAQGPAAPGGAKQYVRDGQMRDGFAFLAWPATYGNSGIMSFVVGNDGTVFQKDLGPNTAAAAAAITRFNPDPTWARIDITDEQ